MQEITLNNFQELHARFQNYDPMYDIFRGVTNSEYQLIPTVGRMVLKIGQQLNKVEKRMLRTFKERSALFVESAPKKMSGSGLLLRNIMVYQRGC